MTPNSCATKLAPPLPIADVDRLADEIAEVASHIDAAEHRLLTLIRLFDEGSGWATHGALSCAHWLNWRIGLDLGAARERVRVARALGALPLVDDALRRGAISYSKVRALTRVARPATEATLLEMAAHATASQLERICRGYRRVLDDADTARPESLADEELRRFVRIRDTDDGMVRIEARLRPEEAALVVHALDVARRRAWRSGGAAADTAPGNASGMDRGVAGVSAETSATRATTLERGQQPHEPSPALSRADALVAVAEGWLATTADADSRRASAGPPIELVVHVDQAALLGAPQAPADGIDNDEDVATSPATLADGTAISLETARRLACDASVVLAIDDARTAATSRRTRRISPRLRRALRLRDDGCRFPGCTNRLTDAHHVEHWVDGGATRLANLCSLCRRHHRLVHEHGYRIVAALDGAWEFVRGDGSPVPVADTELRASSRRVARDDLGAPHEALSLTVPPRCAPRTRHAASTSTRRPARRAGTARRSTTGSRCTPCSRWHRPDEREARGPATSDRGAALRLRRIGVDAKARAPIRSSHRAPKRARIMTPHRSTA